MSGQTITVSVLADTKKFSSAMRDLGDTSGLSKLAGGVKNVGIALGASVAAVGAVGVAWAGTTLKSLANIERIGAQTDAALASTAGAAGRTRTQIDSLANSIEDLSGIEGETITEGQNLLLTFTGIKGTNFDRATQTMSNMAVALNKGSLEGLDMKSTATQLGKALNDPINGITALTKVGVTFTDQQKAQIKAMVDVGDTAGAQTVILDELNKEFGGSAAAAGETTIGVFKRIKNVFDEVSEKLFASLLPMVKTFANWLLTVGVPTFEKYANIVKDRVKPILADLATWWDSTGKPGLQAFGSWLKDEILPRLQKFADSLKTDVLPRIQALASWITGSLMPAMRDFVGWIIQNRDWLAALGIAIGTVVLAIKTYQTAMALWKVATIAITAVQAAFNVVMAANPISLIVLAIAGLVAGLVYFFTQTETGKKAWASLSEAFSIGWEWIQAAFKTGVEFVTEWLGKIWDFIKTVWSYSPLGLIIGNWDKITGAFSAYVDIVKGLLGKAWDFIKTVWSYSPLGLIVENWDKITDFFTSFPQRIRDALGNVGDILKNAGKQLIDGLVNGIKDKFGDVKKTLGDLTGKLTSWKGPPSRDAKLLVNNGQLVIDSFIDGLTSRFTRAQSTLGTFTNSLATAAVSSVPFDAVAATSGARSYVIQVKTGVGDPVAIGREVSNALAAYERVNGGRR